jgi:hypothetical protein
MFDDGASEGPEVGSVDGVAVGLNVGSVEGAGEGGTDGSEVWIRLEGELEGLEVGLLDGSKGAELGAMLPLLQTH